jgi:hypothetical protein
MILQGEGGLHDNPEEKFWGTWATSFVFQNETPETAIYNQVKH